MYTKQCIICNTTKSLTEYDFRKDSGKYRAECKQCRAAKGKAYREQNKDKIKARIKSKYNSNPEEAKEKARLDYQLNKDKRKATALRYYHTHKNKLKQIKIKSFKEECSVKLIDYQQGQEFLLEHHYLKRKAPARFTFGLFLSNGALVGVATFAVPFSVPLKKMICGEEQQDNIIELNRLALRDYMPRNSESWFVAQCLNSGLIDKDILVTFADTAQGHQGTIYKALNFIYTGMTYPTREYAVEGHSYKPGMEFKGKGIPLRTRSKKHRFVYFIRNRKKLLPLLKI
jgi:hypothetical protein